VRCKDDKLHKLPFPNAKKATAVIQGEANAFWAVEESLVLEQEIEDDAIAFGLQQY